MNNPFSRSAVLLMSISLPMLFIATMLTLLNINIILEWELIWLNSSLLPMTLILDSTGTITSATVMFIASNVMMFAKSYMQDETFKPRFNMLVMLFVLSMNMLIFMPNLIILLLGWDGLGIMSVLLVIYYQSPKALGAGMITALTNRIGDAMLLIAIALSLNQNHWSLLSYSFDFEMSSWTAMAILIAAMTKSAQMPFSSWLPAAMAAPTPVSALVHSSTLVTAGVFLLIRFYPFLSSFHWFTTSLLFISCSTMLMAGMSALLECDLKKIIALSTLSQLGVMMAAIGLHQPKMALFHLITHALFKALLFVCAGTLIHYHHHTQDLRTMGNLSNQMPITMSTMTIANLSLCGFPFLSGFYSKDLIIESALFFNTNIVMLIYILVATLLTTAYSVRLTLSSLVSPNFSSPLINLENKTNALTTPSINLAVAAIVAGASLNWALMPSSTPLILSSSMKMLTLAAIISGLAMAMILYFNKKKTSKLLSMNSNALYLMWFLTPVSSQFMLKGPLTAGKLSLTHLDQSWAEVPAQGNNLILSKTAKSILIPQKNIMNKYLLLSMVLLMVAMTL